MPGHSPLALLCCTSLVHPFAIPSPAGGGASSSLLRQQSFMDGSGFQLSSKASFPTFATKMITGESPQSMHYSSRGNNKEQKLFTQ
jgi:hypothetical protein